MTTCAQMKTSELYSSPTDIIGLSSRGWTAPAKIDVEQWTAEGRALLKLQRALPFVWGDWWLAAPNRAKARALIKEWDGLDFHTLKNYAAVAKAFPSSRRRDGLSFGHHEAVAGKPPEIQDQLLDRCQEEKWSVNRLRREARGDDRRKPEAPLVMAVPTRTIDAEAIPAQPQMSNVAPLPAARAIIKAKETAVSSAAPTKEVEIPTKSLDEAIEILEGLGHVGIRVRGEQAERLRRAVDRITSQDYDIQDSSNPPPGGTI